MDGGEPMTPNETGVEKWLLLLLRLLRLQELTLNDHFWVRSLLAAAAICFLFCLAVVSLGRRALGVRIYRLDLLLRRLPKAP